MKWYSVPEIKKINEPFMKRVQVAGKDICVVGYKSQLFAVSALCPHQGFDLSRGFCENDKIICPVHGYSFDLQTGKGSQDFIKTYAVKIQDGVVFIGMRSVLDDIKQLFNK
jgi:nitrite reductase/ring-hydroxylating ferredoxin subunit